MPAVATHKGSPSVAALYDRLKTMIVGGELAGGEPLVERTLAARLGVSRTPVREILFRLEREGLVELIEGRGAFVASYSIEDMIEIYEMREGLEPLAARLYCPHVSDKDLDHHEEQLKRYRARPSLRQENPEKWRLLGQEFHNLFIHGSKNTRLIRAIEGMRHQIELFRGLGRTINPQTDMKTSIDEHWEILRALRARNPDRAEKAVRSHLQNGLRHRLEALQARR
jgi:DNA-binding GntR family transcriptional regulator